VAEKPKKQITLADAYNVLTPEDSRELYAQWAPTYDKTFIEDTKYIYPAKIARVLAKHMPADRSFTVIDIGCGTGAVGEEIAKIELRRMPAAFAVTHIGVMRIICLGQSRRRDFNAISQHQRIDLINKQFLPPRPGNQSSFDQ